MRTARLDGPQSTAEAENAVYATCGKDMSYFINMWGSDGLQMPIALPLTAYCDNEAAVTTIKKPGVTQRTKHYETWVQYGRELYLNNKAIPVWIETIYQVADVFTKALDKTTFLKFRAALLNLPYEHMPEKLRAILG